MPSTFPRVSRSLMVNRMSGNIKVPGSNATKGGCWRSPCALALTNVNGFSSYIENFNSSIAINIRTFR